MRRFKGADDGRNVLEHMTAGIQEVEQDRDPGRSAADTGFEPFGDGRRFQLEERGLEDDGGRARESAWSRGRQPGGQPGRERVDLLARLLGPGTVADEEDGVQIFLTSETRPPRLLAETSASST
jgi:hypothetical protein